MTNEYHPDDIPEVDPDIGLEVLERRARLVIRQWRTSLWQGRVLLCTDIVATLICVWALLQGWIHGVAILFLALALLCFWYGIYESVRGINLSKANIARGNKVLDDVLRLRSERNP